jgi:hypothetical protein
MGLMVSAHVLRELIVDGEYLVECIEQREHGKIALAFALRSRTQPYTIQIETMDKKLGGLFRVLSGEKPLDAGSRALVQVGSQPIPVVEVDSIPADASRGRGRRKRGINNADVSQAVETTKPAVRRRTSARQLTLVAQVAPNDPAMKLTPSKRRRTARARDGHETP